MKRPIIDDFKLRDYLVKRFKGWKSENRGIYEQHKQTEQPIIDAISELGINIKTVTEQNQNLITELVPVAARNILNYPITPLSSLHTPSPVAPRRIEATQDPIELGLLAQKYLSTPKDNR